MYLLFWYYFVWILDVTHTIQHAVEKPIYVAMVLCTFQKIPIRSFKHCREKIKKKRAFLFSIWGVKEHPVRKHKGNAASAVYSGSTTMAWSNFYRVSKENIMECQTWLAAQSRESSHQASRSKRQNKISHPFTHFSQYTIQRAHLLSPLTLDDLSFKHKTTNKEGRKLH